jgi:hypothetical protein
LKAYFGLIALLIACACSGKKEQNSQAKADSLRVADSIARLPPPEKKKDAALDAAGRFIAAIEQEDSTSYSKLQEEAAWKKYKVTTDSNWNRLGRERLAKMQKWQPASLAPKINDSLTVFYPFSGPDFLHAYYLFPKATEFILVALEPIMDAVKLDELKASNRNSFLDSVSHSLRDSFQRSYFQTLNMAEDFKKVKGVLPLLYFFVERTGHELVSQQFINIDSAGREVQVEFARLYKKRVPGVVIEFRDRETRQMKKLYYFSMNVINDALKKSPELEKFLQQKKPFNTFVKSASYLMHRDTFAEIKRLITDNSESVFQDDTGIPYKEFRNKLDWNIVLYGEYKKPIKLFEVRYQADLDSAYKVATNKEPIPFTLGYHHGSKDHNYMLVKKTKTSQPK